MKVIIKDDQSGPKKDSEKLAIIKKSEKAGNLKISEAKKTVISEAIIDATNQTPAAASSTSNENLFSHFTSPQKAFTSLASTFSGVAFTKDPVLGSTFKSSHQPYVFGEQSLVPKSLKNDQQSSTSLKPSIVNNLVLPSKINAPQTVTVTSVTMKGNTDLNESINKQQSSTTARLSMHNSSVVPDITNSEQTETGAQAITTTFNDSLNNLQSSTPASTQNSLSQIIVGTQTMKEKTVDESLRKINDYLNNLRSSTPVSASTQNSLSQTTASTRPMKEKTIILNDSLSNLLSSSTVQSSMQNSLVSNTTNLTESLSDVQPMEENGTFDDFLKNQESLNSITPSMNNSCGNSVNSEQCVLAEKLVENNTKQVTVSPVQPSVENINSGKSSHVQRFSVSLPVPVQNSHGNNIQKAYDILKKLQYSLQYSMSTQTQVSNTTLSVSKDKNVLPSTNSSTKGVKRKAKETKNEVKNSGSSVNSGNLGKKKKNKKKQKFLQPQIVKRNWYYSQDNFSEMSNSNDLTCAIVEERYPNMPPLNNIHLRIIRNVIKEKIDNIPLGVFVPKFMNAFIKDGVILVQCADNNSKDWLKYAISTYSPQEGIYLKVIPPDAINEYYPASIFVHDEENAIDVLRRLQKQNSDVNILNWQYISMIIVKESTPGITINVGIPATSVVQLKEKNFKLFHAMDQVMVVMNVAIPF